MSIRQRGLLFILLLSLAVGGCSREKGGEEVVLKWMMWGGLEAYKFDQDIIKLFEQKYPKIKVKLDFVTSGGYETKVLANIAGGNIPDLFYVSNWQFARFAEKGVLMDLTNFAEKDEEFDTSDFYSEALRGVRYKGGIYGYPFQFGLVVLYYNKALFDQEKISYPDETWTWETFLSSAKKLTNDTDENGKIDQYGFLFDPNWPTQVLPWVWQNGGDLLNEEQTESLSSSPEFMEVIQFLYDLLNTHKVTPNIFALRERGANELFMTGNIAMYQDGIWAMNNLKKIKNFDWDIAVLPYKKHRATTISAACICIAKDAKHPVEAWEFIKFFLEPEIRKKELSFNNSIPINKSLKDYYLEYVGKTFAPGKNHKAAFNEIEYSRFIPVHPKCPEIDNAVIQELELVWLNKRSVEKSCKALENRITKILKENKISW